MQIFKFTLFLIFFLTLFSISQAKMYKWIDENGTVHYTNIAPPATAKKVETSKEVIENPEAKIIRIHNEQLARDEEAALKQYQKKQSQLMRAEQRRRDVEASRVQYTSPPKRVGLTQHSKKCWMTWQNVNLLPLAFLAVQRKQEFIHRKCVTNAQ